VRKLASNPRFSYPQEADQILSDRSIVSLLTMPNVRALAAVGSLAIGSVPRPLKDWDLMLVVESYDEYWARREEIQALLPRRIGDMKVDWFVGESMSGSLGAVDLQTAVLHLSYEFPHSVDPSISGVVSHDLVGQWPEQFQALIDEATGREHSHENLGTAEETWKKGKRWWQMASDFAAAITSGRGVSPDVYRERHIACHGTTPEGVQVGRACLLRRESKRHGGYYCGACGCGDKKLANLSADPVSGKSKLQFVELTCPLKKKGFSNADSP
jgi:hypothetical protein